MAKEKINMEVNVTMTEEEYEDFRAYKQLNKKEYLENQITKHFSLLECLQVYGIDYKNYTGHVEHDYSTDAAVILASCESPGNDRGYIAVDIREYCKERQGEKHSQWLRASELKEMGVHLND